MDFSWLWIVPVLGVLVVVHEMGHFFSARLLGIKVEEFGIGFPPRVFAIRHNGIDYSLNWLPIGGFVKIVGENGDSDDPASFGRAPAWKRIIVLAAGSFMNLVLAFVIFASLAVSGTTEVDAPSTGVGSVSSGQPAATAGMQPGDRIVSVGGQEVSNSDQVRSLSRKYAGTPTDFVVDRNGKEITLKITPNPNPPGGTAYLGITLDFWVSPAKVGDVRAGSVADKAGLKPGDEIIKVNGTTVNNQSVVTSMLASAKEAPQVTVMRNGKEVGPFTLDVGNEQQKSYGFALYKPQHVVYYNPAQAVGKAIGNTWEVVSNIPKGIAQAFAGQAQGPGVTGPVGIAQLTGEVAQEGGFDKLLNLTALLSISLFLINMLPLPALDGGRLLFILIELVRGGRRIAPEKEGMVHFAGMMVLLAFMLIITVFDVQRIFEGGRLLP
ncbi:MAG: RIP metalloprotease RseP [Chloroflexia bacterium]